MTGWSPVRIRIEIALLTVLSYAGVFFFGAGMCMIGSITFGRMDRSMADCLVYVALGISLYLYGQVFTEKKEKELKEIEEVTE